MNELSAVIEAAQLEGVNALARTIADELLQPLIVIKAELDLAMMFDNRIDEATLERLYNAIHAMTERVRSYQMIDRFETHNPIPEMGHYKLLVI